MDLKSSPNNIVITQTICKANDDNIFDNILSSSLQSVMHYSNYAFSRNGEPTIISKIYPRLRFGQRQQLSTLDVEEINRLYECKKKEFDPTILHDDMTPDQALEMRDQLEGSDDGQ